MFKYLWIVMLVITILAYIGWVAYTLYKTFIDHHDSLVDFFDYIEWWFSDYAGTAGSFLGVGIFAIIIVFVISLVMFLNGLGE